MTAQSLTTQYRGAAVSILAHVLALCAGFSLLAMVFEFPEILRQPAPYRLALYLRNQTTVQAVYWMLAMTGFTQIAMAVFLHRSFREKDSTVLSFALVFGILTGILQTVGYIRWAVLMPYLAAQMADPAASTTTREAVALVEEAFNRYAGMALGEHTANLCLGLWTGLRESPWPAHGWWTPAWHGRQCSLLLWLFSWHWNSSASPAGSWKWSPCSVFPSGWSGSFSWPSHCYAPMD
jgi:hypothetical protein